MLRDSVIGLAVAALGVVYWRAAGALPQPLLRQAVGPDVFPRLVAGALMVLGALLVTAPLLRRVAGRAPRPAGVPETTEVEPAPDWRTIALVLLGLGLYALAYERLGFVVATILFMAYEVLVMEVERTRWLWAAPAIVLIPVVLYVVFVKLLGVTLPAGILG